MVDLRETCIEHQEWSGGRSWVEKPVDRAEVQGEADRRKRVVERLDELEIDAEQKLRQQLTALRRGIGNVNRVLVVDDDVELAGKILRAQHVERQAGGCGNLHRRRGTVGDVRVEETEGHVRAQIRRRHHVPELLAESARLARVRRRGERIDACAQLLDGYAIRQPVGRGAAVEVKAGLRALAHAETEPQVPTQIEPDAV